MVFESVVTDLLNKFLGDLVENLDRSQLKLGIWGGDVVLRNLKLKKNALDELNLPVRIAHGFLEKLELKIPWTNLYNAPVTAVIDGLFLIAVPKSTVVYDPEKEDKLAWEAKQHQIQRGEDIHALRSLSQNPEISDKDSTFLEKLSFQIIKNIQIRISSVHFRYEDGVSNPYRSFSLGVTMYELSLESTDSSWEAGTKPQEDSPLIHKLATLNALTVYWTEKHESLSSMGPDEAVNLLKDYITRDGHQPFRDSTVMGPITSTAKLRLNPRPEQGKYSLPKIFFGLTIESLDVVFLRRQYQDLMFLTDNMGRMRRADPYRKYRPNVGGYRGHYRAWWKFAYVCILETVVRRRRRNFSWDHILDHRRRCRKYQSLYEKKLREAATKKELPAKIKEEMVALEKSLDVFNILRLRRQAELTVKKEVKSTPPKKTGWFSGWLSSSPSPEADGDNIANKISMEMTPAEKAKLYEAIGYVDDESAPAVALPADYVAHVVEFRLKNLGVHVKKRKRGSEGVSVMTGVSTHGKFDEVLRSELHDVHVKITQVPASKRTRAQSTIGGLTLVGVREKTTGQQVNLLRSMPLVRKKEVEIKEIGEDKSKEQDDVLMWCDVEVNPRTGVDYGFHLGSHPIELYYDAPTTVAVMDVFTMPKESVLAQLELAAYETMEDIRTKSALGLQYAMETSTIVDMNVKFRGPFLIVPEGGRMTPKAKLLVFGFGDLTMKSETETNRQRKTTLQNIIRDSLSSAGKGRFSEELLGRMRSESYHRYQIELHHMQVLVVDPEVNWQQKIKEKETPHHVIAPISFRVALDHCVLDNDPMLPKLAVTALVPEIKVDLEETQFYDLLNISYSAGASYPAAAEKDAQGDPERKAMIVKSVKESKAANERSLAPIPEHKEEESDAKQRRGSGAQITQLDLKFEITETKFIIRSQVPLAEKLTNIPLLHFGVVSLQADLVLKTTDIEAGLSVGGVEINTIASSGVEELEDSGSHGYPLGVLPLVRTAMIAGEAEYLITVRYTHVDKNGPDFKHLHGGVVQRLVARFADFEVSLQEMAVRKLLAFAQHVQGEIEKINARFAVKAVEKEVEAEKEVPVRRTARRSSAIFTESSTKMLTGNIQEMVLGESAAAMLKSSKTCSEITFFAAHLQWRSLGLKLAWGSRRNVYKIRTVGLSSSFAVRKENVEFDAKIEDIHVCESDPIGPYGTLVKSGRADAMKINVNIYELKGDEQYVDVSKADVAVRAVFGGLDIVYVQRSFLELIEIYNEVMEAVSGTANEAESEAGGGEQSADVAAAATVAAATATNAAPNVPQLGGDSIARAQRVKLNVSIKAPVVYVPRNIHSLEAFVGDFGEIKIINEFRLGERKNELGQPSMYSDYLIRLTNLNLSRCLLAVDSTKIEDGGRERHQKSLDEEIASVRVLAKVMIFEPITVTIGCQQNLSSSWLFSAPMMEFYGHFEDVKGKFADEDYDVLMLTLSENLADAPAKAPRPSGGKSKSSRKSKSEMGKDRVEKLFVSRDANGGKLDQEAPGSLPAPDRQTSTISVLDDSDGPPRVSVACLLRLETISLELFTGTSNLAEKPKSKTSRLIERDPKKSLAEMKLTGICVGARVKTDSTIQSHVRLEDCVIHDSRYERRSISNRTGIRDIFHRKVADKKGAKSDKGKSSGVSRQSAGEGVEGDDDERDEELMQDDSFNAKVELDVEDNLLNEMQEQCDPPVRAWLDLFSRCDASEDEEEATSTSGDDKDTFYDAPEDESQVDEVLEREKSGAEALKPVDSPCELQELEVKEPGKRTADLFKDFSNKIRSCAGSKDNMLDVVYRINAGGETHVKVRTAHSVVVADMKYLMALSEFFQVSEDTRRSTSNVMVRQTSRKPAPPPTSPSGVKPGVMIVRLLINEPDIALVEDMDDIDTNAVIVNTKLNFLASFDGNVTKYQGSFSRMRMYSGVYNPARRRETTNMILKPTGFSVIMKTVVGEEQKIDLNLGPMIFRIDPSTITLLTAIYAKALESGFSKPEDEAATQQEVAKVAATTLEGSSASIWDFTDLIPSDFEFSGEDFGGHGDEDDPNLIGAGRIPPLIHQIHEATDALSIATTRSGSSRRSSTSSSAVAVQEFFVLEAKKIMITLEYGAMGKPTPVIMLESGITGDASNWSSNLDASFTVSFQIASYNPEKAIWEPLLEPVETIHNGSVGRRSFELDCLIFGNMNGYGESDSGVDPDASDSVDSGYGSFRLPSPKMTVNCVSKDILNLTVSKTSLNVMTELSASFSEAAKLEMKKKFVPHTPYVFKNELGLDVVLELKKTNFRVVQNQRLKMDKHWVVGSDTVGMDWIDGVLNERGDFVKIGSVVPRYQLGVDEILKEQDLPEQRSLFVTVMNETHELPASRSGLRYFPIGGESEGFIEQVTHESGFVTIALTSTVEVENMFVFPIQVFYAGRNASGKEDKILCGEVEPEGKLNLPFQAVHSPTAEIFFGAKGVKPSTTAFVWRDLERKVAALAPPVLLCCDPEADVVSRSGDSTPLYINVIGRKENVQLGTTSLVGWGTAKKFRLQLFPTASVQNLLPVPLKVALWASDEVRMPEVDLNPGVVHNLAAWVPGVSSLVVVLPDYLETRWECRVKFDAHPRTKTALTLAPHLHATPALSKVVGVTVGVHTKQKILGSKLFQLFSPFWMINETDLVLTYKGNESLNVFYHQPSERTPVLFAPSKQVDGLRKESFRVRVAGSEFSEKIPLDNVGDVGIVKCVAKDQIMRVGVKMAVASFGLTRMVTLRPYYTLTNACEDLVLRVRGGGRNSAVEWTELAPRQTIPWWPVDSDVGSLVLEVKDHPEISDSFPLNCSNEILLRFRNPIGGIFVEFTSTESSRAISFSKYQPGMAPVVLLNHTADVKIRFWQKGANRSYFLLPMKKIIFTWAPRINASSDCDDEDSDDRFLVWECGKTRVTDKLLQDRCGEAEAGGGAAPRVFWVSFVHRSQRILLFTRNVELASAAQVSFDLEAQDLSLNLTLTDVGLSLVDDKARREVMYMSISSSGITWDLQRGPGKPYKALPASDALQIEKAYEEYIVRQASSAVDLEGGSVGSSPRVAIAKNIVVDFKQMMMSKPNPGRLRRTFHTGVWLHYATSPHQTSIHFKLYNVQIDCQMHDCTFPVVFASVPPQKTVAQLGTRPFVEVALRTRKTESSTVSYHCRYCKVLVQEFFVKLDHVFINGMLEVFGSSEKVTIDFDKDLAAAMDVDLSTDPETPLSEDSASASRIYFELLHFSPIKMHLSYSLAGMGSAGTTGIRSELVDLFLQSIGVTLTDVDDVVFKLGYFERQNRLMTQYRLQSEVMHHYQSQALRQLYVLVLGLDVLGNPFGLAMGIGKGAKDLFYEPIQGAVQGPEEFAEGLALGVRSFVGHTVGGTVGALSKITGTVGKGLAALSMDKNYQRRRKEIARRDGNAQAKFMRNLRGFSLGIVDGVTGVVMQPISGAKEEGVGGFFKGVGKGVVGLVAKPTSGVFDLASSSLDLVRRAADHQGTVFRVRPPRFLDTTGTVRPYSRLSAEGNEVLMNLEKGKYVRTDTYAAHSVIDGQGRLVFLVTNRHIIMAKQSGILGNWEIEWEHPLGDILADPTVEADGLRVVVRRRDASPTGVAKLFSGFRGQRQVHHERIRIIPTSTSQASWLKTKILAARENV